VVVIVSKVGKVIVRNYYKNNNMFYFEDNVNVLLLLILEVKFRAKIHKRDGIEKKWQC